MGSVGTKGSYSGILGRKGKAKTASSAQEWQKIVNPHYGEGSGYSNNCSLCTFATSLQMKGYDVEAMPFIEDDWRGSTTAYDFDFSNYDNYLAPSKTTNGVSVLFAEKHPTKMTLADKLKAQENIGYASMNPHKIGFTAEQASFRIDEFMKNAGNGAYAEISVAWKTGGGHSMFVTRENDETKIFCTQTGRQYVGKGQIQALLSKTIVSQTTVLRLDNANLKDGVQEDLSKMVRRK